MRPSRIFTRLSTFRLLGLGLALALALVAAFFAGAPQPAHADASTGPGGLFVSNTARMYDTSSGIGGAPSAGLTGGTWYSIPVEGARGLPATGISAVQVNFVVTNSTSSAGALHADKGAVTTPSTTVSYVNYAASTTVANAATIAVGTDGTIQVETTTNVGLRIDLQGYYTTGSTAAGGYVPLPATVVANTGDGTGGVPVAKVASGGTLTFPVAGSAGVPSNASGVVLNIQENGSASTGGYVIPFGAGQARPTTTLYWPGTHNFDWTSNVSLPGSGQVSIYVSGGPINLAVSVEGYFTPNPTGDTAGQFTPAAARVYDSQWSPNTPIAAAGTQTVQVAGVNGVPAVGSGVTSVAVALTVIPGTGATGHVQAFADDQTPSPSAAQFYAGSTLTIFVVVPLGADGGISVQNSSSGTLGFVVDVEGWYTSPTTAPSVTTGTSGLFQTATGRILDTRNGTGGSSTPLAANTWRSVQVAGVDGIPSAGVSAVSVLATAVNTAGAGELYGEPDGGYNPTLMMTFNGANPGTTSNTSVLAVGSDGEVDVEANTGTDLVLDIQGYYGAGNGTTAPGGFSPVAGTRIFDTFTGIGVQNAVFGTPTTLAAGSTTTIQVTGHGNVPAGAQAAFVDITATSASSSAAATGTITPYAADATQPTTSFAFPGGSVATSMGAQVALSSTGAMDLTVSGSAVSISVDVEGYFAAGSSSGSFTPAASTLFDSRVKPHVAIAAGKTVTVPIGGVHKVATVGDGLSAAVIDLTALHPETTTGGYAKAWADGTPEPGPLSSISYAPNSTRSNTVTVPVGLDGAIEIHNVSNDTVNYVVNLEGWYAGPSSTLCPHDTDTIQGEAASSAPTVGASDDDPVLSAVLTNSLGNDVNGSIYLVDSNGNPVDGSPTATADIDSGDPLIFHVPPADLTVGATYTWWVHADQEDTCAAQATSNVHTFTVGTPTTPATPTTSTLTITGSALTVATASEGTTDCAGLPCTLTQGSIGVGNDGTTEHTTSIKASIAGLPAGSTIQSATLDLTPNGCYGVACMSGTLNIAESPSDVAAAATGTDLAGINTNDPLTFPEATSSNAYDITSIVQDWYDGSGSNNFGAVLTETNTVTGATGETFAGPAATTTPASITVTYTTPTLPTAVQSLTATAGDGGLIASWADPATTGWYDSSGATNGLTGFTASLLSSTGTVVSTQTVTQPQAVFTGLANGSAYSVTVTPTNPAGNGPAATSTTVQSTAVTNGAAAYITAVQNLVTAEDTLSAGGATSSSDATASDADADTVQTALGIVATGYENENDQAILASQTDDNDASTLSNTVAVQNGSTVTVYTTVTETYTTVDTSTGTEFDRPGGAVDDMAFEFSATGSTITFARAGDEYSLLAPVTEQSVDTAFDATTIAAMGDTSSSLSAFTPFAPASTIQTVSAGKTGPKVNLTSTAAWAVKWWNGQWNGYRDDCTDFASRALHFGGGEAERGGPTWQQPHNNPDPNAWFDVYRNVVHSTTWGVAPNNEKYQTAHGGKAQTSVAGVKPGWIAYGALKGKGIDHTAIVTAVNGSNVWVAQHTDDYAYDPIYRVQGQHSWYTSYPKAKVLFVNPTNI